MDVRNISSSYDFSQITSNTPNPSHSTTMGNSKTVTDSKATFLRQQVRLLSAILQPSATWRDFGPESEAGDIPSKVIDDVLHKVNEKLKQHNRSVYSVAAQRHLAEQVDTLYWQDVQRHEASAESDATVVDGHVDLMSAEAVERLPEGYADLKITVGDWEGEDAEEAEQYQELRQRLVELSRKGDEQKARLEQYRHLQSMLAPFENAQENVQPNLVTRDGELGKELERMRVLLARLTGRAEEMKSRGGAGAESREMSTEVANQQKLAAVMDLT